MGIYVSCYGGLGWGRDLPSLIPWFDHRALLARMAKTGVPVVSKTNNEPLIDWVFYQGDEGSCVTNSGSSCIRYVRKRLGLPLMIPSRQQWYYCTRQKEGTIKSDAGCSIADAVAVEASVGVCSEKTWPYSKPFASKPSAAALAEAKLHKALKKEPVEQTREALFACLAAGQPLHGGLTLYSSFESAKVAKSGIVPMPKRNESVLGGHGLWWFDMDADADVIIGSNSWGTAWGRRKLGIFTLPVAYAIDPDLAGDFWTVSKVA